VGLQPDELKDFRHLRCGIALASRPGVQGRPDEIGSFDHSDLSSAGRLLIRQSRCRKIHDVGVGRWSRGAVILVLLASGLMATACSSALIDPSHQDGYYWYRADGVDIIKTLQKHGDSLTEACSAQVVHVMPRGDNRGDWVTGCVYAAKDGNQP
jgi:hypothetical protein